MILSQTKTFLRDCKKFKISDKHYTRFIQYLALLSQEKILPVEAKDHELKGEWEDFREFHVSGDLLVIYQITGDTIKLIRLGTHSQLFKS